jgi:putative ABC transport system permease protein
LQAVFTLINAVMFKSLPVSHPEELVEVTGLPSLNPVRWNLIRNHQNVLSGVFVHGVTGGGDLSIGGEARPTSVAFVSGGFFATLGVQLFAGRTLADADDYRGCRWWR